MRHLDQHRTKELGAHWAHLENARGQACKEEREREENMYPDLPSFKTIDKVLALRYKSLACFSVVRASVKTVTIVLS